MADLVQLWNAAAAAFDQRYDAMTDASSDRDTPCAEWKVKDLVAHAVGVQATFGGVLGASVAADAAWPEARDAMRAAISAPGGLDGTAHYAGFGGDVPKAMLISIATTDLVIHTWDLSRALGVDATLPAESAAAALAGLQGLPTEVLRSPGRFGAAVEVAADADVQTQLLAFAGRKP